MSNEDPEGVQKVIEAFKYAYDKGVLSIVAAGNYGPLPGTLSAFAQLPWVLSVGATDLDGTKLGEFSSTGIPGDLMNKPDLVAPGINIIGAWDPNKPKTKSQIDYDEQFITIENIYKQNKQEVLSSDLEYIKKNCTLMEGTSQATTIVTGLSAKLIELRKANDLDTSPLTTMRILKCMAVPIDGYDEWQIGSGFLNLNIFDEYLTRINRAEFHSKEEFLMWSK